jgi:hypothetical protein
MHPFNFLPGLQSGKEGYQGLILGLLRLRTVLEVFAKVGSIRCGRPHMHIIISTMTSIILNYYLLK